MSMDVALTIATCAYALDKREGSEDAVTGSWVHQCSPSVRIVELPFGFVYNSHHSDRSRVEIFVQNQYINRVPLHGGSASVSVSLVGGLGNQLFQAASSFGIAVSRGAKWCIPNLDGSLLQRSVVFHVNPTSCKTEGVERADERGGFLEFQSWMMNGITSIHVGNYLQSFRYFSFSGLPFELRLKKFGQEWVEKRNIKIGIHVRRTDQLTEAHGGKDPGSGYYMKALAVLRRPDLIAVVCTDDVDWVKAQPVFDGMFICNGTTEEDMAILAACEHMIMSIGTFGWWAAFLRSFEGETFYYATPFLRNLKYYEHFPAHWKSISDSDIQNK